jgi:hypothetical protein
MEFIVWMECFAISVWEICVFKADVKTVYATQSNEIKQAEKFAWSQTGIPLVNKLMQNHDETHEHIQLVSRSPWHCKRMAFYKK